MQSLTTLKIPATKYLPPHVCAEIEPPLPFSFAFSKPERARMRQRKTIPPSEWAPKHRRITKGDLAGGMMDLRITPHLSGIMDASFFPSVRRIAIQAAPQTAKTTAVDTCIAWAAVFAPGDALSVYPDQPTAERSNKKRLQPLYKGSPQLTRLLTGRPEDLTRTSINLLVMDYEMAWAGSATSLADRSVKYLDLQEVDKYKVTPNKREGGTIGYAKNRVRAYPNNHKIWISSSPTDEAGNIHVVISKETEAVFVYWVTCPLCASEELMEFTRDRFTWPHGEDGKSIDRKEILSKKLARYVCSSCEREWNDHHRNQAILLGTWRLRTEDGSKGEELFRHLQSKRPSSIGFIVPSWISYFVSLSEVAHDFLKSKDADLSPEERFLAHKDFCNNHKAQAWSWVQQEQPVKAVLALRDDRPEGLVPGGNRAAALVAGVDTQDDGFWFWIMAVGYGRTNEQWLVRSGFVTSFEALAEVLWIHEYMDVDGGRYPVALVVQDAMGHRTKEVYEFCVDHRDMVLPSKGRDTMDQAFRFSKLEFFPGGTTPIPGGLLLMNINTKYYKDNMAVKLNVKPGLPGGIHFHAEFPEEEAKQLIAEARDEKGMWQQIGSRANHLWL